MRTIFFDILCTRIHKSIAIVRIMQKRHSSTSIHLCIHFTCLTEKCNGMAWRANRRYMLYNICIILFIDVRLENYFFFLSLFVCSMIKEQTLNPFASIEPYIRFLKQAKDAFTLTIFTFLTKIPSKCTLILLALIFMFAQWECSRRVSSVLWSRLGNNV